jgi:hypothetical protein
MKEIVVIVEIRGCVFRINIVMMPWKKSSGIYDRPFPNKYPIIKKGLKAPLKL